MKILYVASDVRATGGIQQYNRKLLKTLEERGDKVILVQLKKGGGIFSKILFFFICLVAGFRHKPGLIVCAHINYAPIGLLMKKLFGRDYIVCTHGVDVWDIKSPLKRRALEKAKVITTVAEFTRDKILAQIESLRVKCQTSNVKCPIYLLYNPVDGNLFMPKAKPVDLIRRYGLEGKKIIFTVARLLAMEGYKGYDRVIRAMPEILRAAPNALYLLAGDGDDAPRVKNLIGELNLQDKVIMTGYVPNEELVDYYNLADVFIMPSKAEGAPAVFIEALACGIPVIAGNQDGSATPLLNGEVGLLINPDSVEEIASAIIDVLTGRARKELLDRDFLRRKVLEKFGLEHFPQKVDEALRRVSAN